MCCLLNFERGNILAIIEIPDLPRFTVSHVILICSRVLGIVIHSVIESLLLADRTTLRRCEFMLISFTRLWRICVIKSDESVSSESASSVHEPS